ncbi:MAG: gliding motility-associated C-terminal domain-containing protein [Flavipsychrobacter sp.]|nr:gliding motility-associated C-terminal domain-containing protein [Flavipsychrobacter sp.]
MTATAPVNGRHEITNGPGVDQYGNFPIVAPGGNQYSLKLGNNVTGAQAERVRYYVQVPSGLNNYSLVYRYAVVFENPGHNANDQPRFEVRGYDSATMTPIPCATYTYISSGQGNTGFTQSTVNAGVWYKAWTTASLNLSGWGGNTVLLEFSSGDCALSGHFGYGYVDMNCGLFQVSGNACGLSTTTLSAPYGFQTYTWYTSGYTSTVGSGQIITIPTPPVTTTYHVVIQPQTGFGCPDTLTTTVNVTDMVFGPGNSVDTTVCPGANVQLHVQATGTTGPYTYSWFPTTGLSNPNSPNPIAIGVNSSITYYASATDTNGCIKLDTINITVNNFNNIQMNVTNIPCFGGTGSITAVPQGGQGPYTYSWQPGGASTSTISGLAPGTYTVTVTDNMGCVRTQTATVTQPPNMNLQMTGSSINCFGQTNGSVSVVVTGGTPPYGYNWQPGGANTSTVNGLTGGTYTLTVTDANNCQRVGTVTVTSPPQLTASMTNIQHINCFGQNTGCATVAVAGGTPPYTYFWSSTPPQYTATACNLYAGNYTCQVTDANGCTATATVSITQPAQLTAAITNQINTTCSGSNGSATVTANGGTSPYTYLWSNGQTTAQATGLAPGLYTVTVTDNKGCTTTTQVQIASSSQMNLAMSSVNAGCNGQSNGSASVVVSGGTPPYGYVWSPSGGTGSTTTPITAGNYIVTVTDAQGCVAFGNVTVGQPPAVNAAISNIAHVNCNGLFTGSAMGSGTSGTPPYSYQWSNGQNTAMATSLAAGTYTLTVTDAQGCFDTAQVTINQPPPVTATITASANATCSQNNGTVTVTPGGGVPPYTFLWSNAQTTATISGLAPGSYTCTVKDANNCPASVTINIQGTTSLTVDAVKGDVSCFGLQDGWAAVDVPVGVQPFTFSWTGTTSTTDSATGLAAGQYVVNVTDATGCPGTVTINITQPTSPLAAAINNPADAKCFGSADGSAMATAAGGTAPYTYLWNPIGSNVQNPTNLSAGTYQMIVTDDHGCMDSADVIINEPTDIVFSAQATGSSCEGMNQGTAEATVSGGTTPYTVAWGTTPPQTGLNATGLNPGNYTVLVTDGNGCQKSTTVTVGGFPSPTVDAGADKFYCFGLDGVQLNASGAQSYQWTPGAGLSDPTIANPVATPNATTTYLVTGTDPNGCQGTDQVTVTVYREQVTAVGQDKDICVGDIAQLTATGGESYIWTPGESLNNSSIYNPVATPTATTQYQVIVVQNPCFSDTLIQEVRVHQRPTVNLGPDRKELSGSTIIITADTANADNITWAPPTNLSCYDCDAPTVSVELTASYVVTVSNPGCSATDDININVTCEKNDLFIANTFTPNGDGNNDYFYPQTPGINKMQSMMVFNRWGEKVFEAFNFPANNPSFGWDGSYKGKPLTPDTYVYIMEYICGDGTKISLKGDISIVR